VEGQKLELEEKQQEVQNMAREKDMMESEIVRLKEVNRRQRKQFSHPKNKTTAAFTEIKSQLADSLAVSL